MARNRYNVPAKQWRKWSEQAHGVFNAVFKQMVNTQWAYIHPKQEKAKREHWRTTAWNAAWTAAGAVDGYELKVEKWAMKKKSKGGKGCGK